jgi:hypothetical protein
MSYNDMGELNLTDEYANKKAFLASFKEILDMRGARYLMSNENSNTFVNHGAGNGSENLNDNYEFMMEIKDMYKTDTNDKNFSEALKQDAKTQLAIIDDIEYKLKNAGYKYPSPQTNFSMGGRTKMKRKQTKRKRRTNKRKSNKRKSNKRKY